MPRKSMTWLPAQSRPSSIAIPPAFKMQVEKKATELVETVLKPRYAQPKPEEPRFNYIIDVGTKWLGSKLFFIATYACPGPTAISPTFQSKFARMEFVGNQRFNLSFMRHTGKWVEIFSGQTLEECLQAIRDDFWFQLA